MNRKSMFSGAAITVFALLTLLSGNAFAEGHILQVHNLSLSITGPSDGKRYNAGEPVTITVKTEGYTGRFRTERRHGSEGIRPRSQA